MKGFKPTGYGPSAGFKFPATFGFTGSTGTVTNVSPYVRAKPRAFKDGGYVRESMPDSGHATVQRSRPYTEEDRESGGRSPLRPGFKRGGKMRAKKMRKADGGAIMLRANRPITVRDSSPREEAIADLRRKVNDTAGDRDFYRASGKSGKAALFQQMINQQKASPVLDESWRHKAHGRSMKPSSGPLSTTMKEKFFADGGQVDYEKPTYMQAVKDRVKEMLRMEGQSSTGLAKRAADRLDERRSRIDATVDSAVSGKTSASSYSRGGKMKRMGYAKGGGVSAGQAKKIAERTVGEHVKYPAPKGHKGLGTMCKD